MVKAVIFDMDGILIDSEPFWQEAEIKVFKPLGLELTHQDCVQTMGMRIDRAVAHWYQHHPWGNSPTQAEVVAAILEEVIARVGEAGEPKPGVYAALDFLRAQRLKLAVASSSHNILIEAVVRKLGIEGYFDLLHSAEFEPYGKPHPGVYLTAANRLSVPAEGCIVIEDSWRGILAAKAAEMGCIAIPDASLVGDPRLSIADWRLNSLVELDSTFWKRVNGATIND